MSFLLKSAPERPEVARQITTCSPGQHELQAHPQPFDAWEKGFGSTCLSSSGPFKLPAVP
jgi:hypothetical protein